MCASRGGPRRCARLGSERIGAPLRPPDSTTPSVATAAQAWNVAKQAGWVAPNGYGPAGRGLRAARRAIPASQPLPEGAHSAEAPAPGAPRHASPAAKGR